MTLASKDKSDTKHVSADKLFLFVLEMRQFSSIDWFKLVSILVYVPLMVILHINFLSEHIAITKIIEVLAFE